MTGTDKDKTQSRRIQSTGLVISDNVTKRDELDGLTIKVLVKGSASRDLGRKGR